LVQFRLTERLSDSVLSVS